MSTYLLLRSNKQSGPYTIAELRDMGLKPYDLIWAEGRSAAWRYPSEIEELQDIAPIVEEQPYDRFYKRGQEEKHFHETNVTPSPAPAEVKKTEIAAPEVKEEKKIEPEISREIVTPSITVDTTPGKPGKIFVALPATRTATTTVSRDSKPQPILQAKDELKPAPAPIAQKEPEKHELKEEYSRSLDDIKRMYEETYLRRKKKTLSREQWLNIGKYAAAAVFIIVLGTFVYSAIKLDQEIAPLYAGENDHEKSNQRVPVKKQRPAYYPPSNNNSDTYNQDDQLLQDQDLSMSSPVRSKPRASGKEEIDPDTSTGPDATETMVREEVHTAKSEPMMSAAELAKKVSVNANDYKIKSFGGIQNLELTVRNDSKYMLDKVMVELKYLKPSEQPLKSEIYYFNAVSANGSRTMRIPDSPRGIKVTYKITHIISSEFDQDIAGL